MKTAEQWTKQEFGPWTVNGMVSSTDEMGAATFQALVAEIQADALEHAADLAEGERYAPGPRNEWEYAYEKGCEDVRQSILRRVKEINEQP